METTRTVRDIAFPAVALTHLRRAFRKEAGGIGTIQALHEAGWASGEPVLQTLRRALRTDNPAGLDEARFWQALDRVLQGWGWGRIEQERVHPGMGMVIARDWMESDPEGTDAQPGCGFTAGLLARLLDEVSPGPVAVLEVGCRSRGDDRCRFLFGAEEAVYRTYDLLLEGHSLDRALAEV